MSRLRIYGTVAWVGSMLLLAGVTEAQGRAEVPPSHYFAFAQRHGNSLRRRRVRPRGSRFQLL